jgi:5'-3' exonuclease
MFYMLSKYDVRIANGIEADDLMGIVQTQNKGETIICSRDKDLRIVPGWHYGWECGKQGSFGPIEITETGFIQKKSNGKIIGGGLLFFYYQLIVGDTVDSIPGLEGRGPKFAYDLLNGITDKNAAFRLVCEAYRERYKDDWMDRINEQIQLLWMVQHLRKDGSPAIPTIRHKVNVHDD